MTRNLIVIVADTLRHPRFFGGTAPAVMPFIQRWSEQGTVLPRLIASSSWTCPSHVSLLAGVDPWQTHFYLAQSRSALPSSRSLADRWREAGGESVAFSENFLVAPELGTAPGYDAYNPGLWARLAGNAQRGVTLLGYEQLLHRVMERSVRSNESGTRGGRGLRGTGTAVYRLINSMRSGAELNRALARGLRRRRADRPLHLFVNFSEPHEPYLLPSEGLGPTSLGHLPSVNLARHTDYLARTPAGDAFRRAYLDSVRELDHQVETLVASLNRHGLLRDAMVVFVSDHGQALGENGFFGHGHYLHDELIEIPGIVWTYRDGRPERELPPATDWVDLRHLHDVLADYADGRSAGLSARFEQSLAARGPAASYWEGPLPRAPAGFLFASERSGVYRQVRLVRGDQTLTVQDPDGTGPFQSLETPGHAAGPAEMADEAARYLRIARGEDGAAAGNSSSMGREVDDRLRSWGYD
ncbi:MAG TPA: sulfatase-like hydrolase/transferase [Thermoplasmata archaeon]|nr:sulfatase-like hydrolase/transferase [Thermoplasmata archaeon]